MDVHFQPEAWYQPASSEDGAGGPALADGYEGLYHSADVGDCIRGALAVRWSVHDAVYGADFRN